MKKETKEREHKTDGTLCWCKPKIIDCRKMKIEMKCPDCRNLLKVEAKGKQEAAGFLYKKGYGVRAIQRILGFRSPASAIGAIFNK